jgi:glycerate dehydrogenase
MRIVVLDGHTLNPGDLDWGELAKLGDLQVYPRTAPEELLPRAEGAPVLLTNKTPLRREDLALLPGLRYVGVLATGTNVVDLPACKERGVVVANAPGYGTASVAQHTLALLLELSCHVGRHSERVREGGWSAAKDFSFWERPLVELADLTMGVVGYGDIGRAVGRLSRAFGMRLLVATRSRPEDGVDWVDRAELLERADVISLHCPLTPETESMIDAGALSLMKPTAFLVNTARGALVDEAELAASLRAGRLAGAALDVLREEPPPADHPLLGLASCIVTPHIAWATRAARERLLKIVVDNLTGFLAGRPRNVVE